jgi:hypothetical protein
LAGTCNFSQVHLHPYFKILTMSKLLSFITKGHQVLYDTQHRHECIALQFLMLEKGLIGDQDEWVLFDNGVGIFWTRADSAIDKQLIEIEAKERLVRHANDMVDAGCHMGDLTVT